MDIRLKTIIIVVISLLAISCNKEIKEEAELNIEVSTELKSSAIAVTYPPQLHVYPNPFKNTVFIYIDGSDNAIINISNEDAYKEVVYEGNVLGFDFSKLESGAYNCEIIVNDKVEKVTLIKE